MDIKYINPFVDALFNILPQLGFSNIEKRGLNIKGNVLKSKGIIIIFNIVGDIKGDILYNIDIDSAKKIASSMMMGMPVNQLDEMSQSALSELVNMVTSNATTNFSSMNIKISYKHPSIHGENFEAKTNCDKVLSLEIAANGLPVEINIALENV